ncbi:HNH endonuclease signature motif containing protein [Rhizobium sp. WYCCWR 11146]|uniref:HNH endonuclease signature motif containing protein n=1 Tax=Rhizobium sp. WYCCWR 11146 TaxID=2749833 RepID=UPI0015E72FC7|nr:HNH endonuclease signature motif containing protein [Rhizobium sp. WYCCWR 11146]MBA1348727.1 HNH endonuclease [Rhizobium sp. WYCCWR 11146]
MTLPIQETHRPAIAEEAWAVVPSIPTHEASTHGRIRVAATGEIVEPYLHRTGYIYIFLRTPEGRQPPKQVHRLVLEAHRGPCPKGFEALHLNDTPTCNLLSNLIWNTKKINGRGKRTEGRMSALRLRRAERRNIERADLCKAYRNGATLASLAKTYRTTRETVKRILMEEGIELRASVRTFDHDYIFALHRAGYNTPAIAAEVGCTVTCAHTVLLAAGVTLDRNTIARDRLKEFHLQGLRPYEIAKRMDCDPDSVTRILEELARDGEITFQKRHARPKTDLDRIRALSAEGKSNAEIVTLTGYSSSTVWKANGNAKTRQVAERTADIVQEFREGRHSAAIAEAHGVDVEYVLRVVRKAGLKVQRGAIRTSYGAAYDPKR